MTNKKSVDGPGTDQMPAVRPTPTPKAVKVEPSVSQEMINRVLLEAGEFPTFDTNELTADMVRDAIVPNIRGFERTDAGYISYQAGVDGNGEIILTITQWTSFNFAEEDHGYQVHLRVGALIPTRLPEVLPSVVDGELLPAKEIGK